MRITTEITEEQVGGRSLFTWEVYDADETHTADGHRLLYGRGITFSRDEAEARAAADAAEAPARAAAYAANGRA